MTRCGFVEKQRMQDSLNRWLDYYKSIEPRDFDFEKGERDVYKTTIDLAPFSTVRPYFLKIRRLEKGNMPIAILR